MPPLAYFGIESSGLNLAIDLLILFVVVLYLSLIYWTYADARRRIADPMLVGCATAASLFPFVGTVIYMILRPPEYLEDVHERELEMQAAEARLHDLDHGLCPHCDYPIERDFVRCPSCLRKLKERCVSCQRPLDQAWTICPYCETEVPGAIAPSRRRRRRAASEGRAGDRRLGEERVSLERESRLGESSLGESSGESPLGESSLGAPSLGESSLGEPTLGESSLGESPLGEPELGEPSLGHGASLGIGGDTTANGLPAVTPAGAEEQVRAKPVAAPETAPARPRSSGRARRPRSTS